MTVNPELKCLVEDYANESVRFLEIVDFYRRSQEDVKSYMDEVVRNLTGKNFSSHFSALLNEQKSAKANRNRKQKRKK
jgi:hypothetical protein